VTAVIARAAIVPMCVESTLRSEQSSQLVLGEVALVLETAGEWRQVRTRLDQYVGWVHAGYCAEMSDAEAEAWHRDARAWSHGATVQVGEARVRLPLRARVALEGEVVRIPDGRRGKIVEGTVTPADQAMPAARAKAPERWALEHFAGAPYEWGGVTPCGVDCSGMVQTTFMARGVQLPRDSGQQVACGAPVSPDAIRPGDLLFFRGAQTDSITHVAFAGEADTLVHSTISLGGMVQEPWLPGSRAASLRDRLVAVRRLEER
jgi:gamma-D-glutamyl-L-lysine dipeptidyl-peptidase